MSHSPTVSTQAWTDVGDVLVPEDATVACADPCYGRLDRVDGTLQPGAWVWQITAQRPGFLDAGEYETRLVHRDHACGVADGSWVWDDDYGQTPDLDAMLPDGIPGQITYQGIRGVDAGTMAWHISTDDDAPPDLEWLLESRDGDLTLFSDGRVAVSDTLFGDGGYVVAARSVDGLIVEVRIQYGHSDPAPLTRDDFLALLPGALPDPGDATSPVTVVFTRHRYLTSWDANPSRLGVTAGAVHEYDNEMRDMRVGDAVYSESGDTQLRYHLEDTMRKVEYLWRRLPAEAKAQFPTSFGEPVPSEDRGWSTERTETPVTVRLRG